MKSKSTTENVWANIKLNWFKYFLKITLYLFLFFLIWEAISPLISFQPFFNWWKSHDGDKYSQWCFSFTKLAYFKYFIIYYYIGSYLSGTDTSFNNDGQPDFILMLFSNYAINVRTDGHMTPKALCSSIIPDKNILKPSPETQDIIKQCTNYQIGDDWPRLEDNIDVNTNIKTWRYIVASWGGAGNTDQGTKPMNISDCTNMKALDTIGSHEKWISAPDNFLYKWYAIRFDSIAVRAFVSGQATTKNQVKLDKTVMEHLLGFVSSPGWSPGGWWGMLQGLSSPKWDYASYQRLFWEDEIIIQQANTECTTGDQINAGLNGVYAAGGTAFALHAGAGAYAAAYPAATTGAVVTGGTELGTIAAGGAGAAAAGAGITSWIPGLNVIMALIAIITVTALTIVGSAGASGC